jgi:hypothetical protein
MKMKMKKFNEFVLESNGGGDGEDTILKTEDIIKKFGLKSSTVKDNGYNKDVVAGVVEDKEQAEKIIEWLKGEGYSFMTYDTPELFKFWDELGKVKTIDSVKVSICYFSKTLRYQQRVGFIFDIGMDNNPIFTFNSSHTNSPLIWLRTSNYSWLEAPYRKDLDRYKEMDRFWDMIKNYKPKPKGPEYKFVSYGRTKELNYQKPGWGIGEYVTMEEDGIEGKIYDMGVDDGQEYTAIELGKVTKI